MIHLFRNFRQRISLIVKLLNSLCKFSGSLKLIERLHVAASLMPTFKPARPTNGNRKPLRVVDNVHHNVLDKGADDGLAVDVAG